MSQARAINTLAFAVVMLSIFFAQMKPETKAKVAAMYRTQISQAATVLALTTGHWNGTLFESDAVDSTAPAQQLEMAQIQTARAHLVIARNQAKLACAQHVLESKMEALAKARDAQAAARVRLVTVAESQADWQ